MQLNFTHFQPACSLFRLISTCLYFCLPLYACHAMTKVRGFRYLGMRVFCFREMGRRALSTQGAGEHSSKNVLSFRKQGASILGKQ